MSRRMVAAAVLLVVLGVAASVLVSSAGLAADSSTLSAGAGGWLAARRYLEARGAQVSVLSGEQAPPRRVLVVAFPWQNDPGWGELDRRLAAHLAAGGRVVLGFDGWERSRREESILGDLGLDWHPVGGPVPLQPLAWWAFAGGEWTVRPDPVSGTGAGDVRIRAPRRVPAAPAAAQVLYRGEGGVPVVFRYPFGKGEVTVVPAEALANARLPNAGNANLLEALKVSLGNEWAFDESVHGLLAPAGATGTETGRAFDLYAFHLAFLYALALFALVRRFGPSWTEPPVVVGTTGSFLAGLGALHARLRHHHRAAGLLLARACELDVRLRPSDALTRSAHHAGAADFLELGREVARLQARAGRPS